MIPVSTLNMLIAVDLIMVVYSIVDHRNRLYANVIVAITSAILSAFIAAAAVSGAIYDVVGITVTPMNSPSLHNLFNFVSTIMFVYSIIMIYEVIAEVNQKKQKPKEFGDSS